MNISSCRSSSFDFTNVVKHLCRDYLKCSILYDPNVNSRVPVCCVSSLGRNLIALSYLTIIVPLLVAFVLLGLEFIEFVCREVSSGLKNLCCRKSPPVFSEGVLLTEEGKKLLVKSLKEQYPFWKDAVSYKDLHRKTGNIEWLSGTGVFRHKKIPGLVFRLPLRYEEFSQETKEERVKEMVIFANKCRQVCQDNHLDLLVIPQVSSECLGKIYGNDWHVLVMEEIRDFEEDINEQVNIRKNLAENPETYPLLQRLEEQIVDFVFLTEYEDVKSNNTLVLNRKENTPLKAAIFDFDQYRPNLRDALIGRNLRYDEYNFGVSLLLMLETKEAFEKAYNQAVLKLPDEKPILDEVLKIRKRLFSIREKQKQLHLERNIKTGLELINLNEITKNDFQTCSQPVNAFETAKEIIGGINSIIELLTKFNFVVRFGAVPLQGKVLTALLGGERGGASGRAVLESSLLGEVCKILVRKRIIADYEYIRGRMKYWF